MWKEERLEKARNMKDAFRNQQRMGKEDVVEMDWLEEDDEEGDGLVCGGVQRAYIHDRPHGEFGDGDWSGDIHGGGGK